MKKIEITTLDNNKLEYTLSDEKLGEGSVGMVYRAKDNQDQDLVAKLCKPNHEESFDRNARLVQQDNLDHFIPIQQIGMCINTQIIGNQVPAGKVNAMVMEYGGSNLKETYDRLTTLNPNVAEAFKYKVLITLCDALDKAHTQVKYHGDLTPFNVVVGIDITQNTNPNDHTLEDLLVISEIRLCDRAAIKEVGSIWVPPQTNSAYGPNAPFIIHFFDTHLEDVCPDRDFYSFFTMINWLMNGNEKMPVETGLKFLGLERTLNTDGTKMVYPAWKEIKSKLIEKIHNETENYFTLDEITKSSGGKKYPVVLRPVDVFREKWEMAKLSTLDELHRMYAPTGSKNPSEVSFQYLTTKGGNKQSGTETEQIKNMMGEVAVRSAQYLNTEIKKYIKKKATSIIEQDKLTTKIAATKKTIDTLVEKEDESHKRYKEQEDKYNKNPTVSQKDSLNLTMVGLTQSHDNLTKEKPQLEKAIKDEEKKIKELELEIDNFNQAPLELALSYINTTIKLVLKHEHRKALEALK